MRPFQAPRVPSPSGTLCQERHMLVQLSRTLQQRAKCHCQSKLIADQRPVACYFRDLMHLRSVYICCPYMRSCVARKPLLANMQAPCSRRFRREGSCLLKPFSKPSDLRFSPTLSAQSTGHKEQLRALPRISNALDLPAKASAARPRRAFEITRSIAQITASSNQR